MQGYYDKKELIAIGKRMYDKGFVAATDGNMSVRLDERHILTTPSGISKGCLTEDDLIVIDSEGTKITGKNNPSSEFRMHLKVYTCRPKVKAVIHAHPPIATALTLAGISLEEPVIPEVVITLGGVPTAPYAPPTTVEMSDSINDLIMGHDAILLERNGVLTVGDSLESAYFKLEKVEHAAWVIAIAHQLGGSKKLSQPQHQYFIWFNLNIPFSNLPII